MLIFRISPQLQKLELIPIDYLTPIHKSRTLKLRTYRFSESLFPDFESRKLFSLPEKLPTPILFLSILFYARFVLACQGIVCGLWLATLSLEQPPERLQCSS